MSSSIWTRCAGDSEIRALLLAPWRAVEAQHQLSTRKLVDTREEQELLETLIDRVKPPAIATPATQHYLLTTPFRYPPLRHGSRFGSRWERGIWYGAETRETMFAEVAYYRMVFLAGTSADLGTITTQLTTFRTNARTTRGVDLVGKPFAAHRASIASPSSYGETQALGGAMRAAGVELIRYPSARDASGGVNVAAFTPKVFGRSKPREQETWHCLATREVVELARHHSRDAFSFPRSQFLVDGTLPAPAL
jgi:hypothetical protein